MKVCTKRESSHPDVKTETGTDGTSYPLELVTLLYSTEYSSIVLVVLTVEPYKENCFGITAIYMVEVVHYSLKTSYIQ
jgi:hypothetical protein